MSTRTLSIGGCDSSADNCEKITSCLQAIVDRADDELGTGRRDDRDVALRQRIAQRGHVRLVDVRHAVAVAIALVRRGGFVGVRGSVAIGIDEAAAANPHVGEHRVVRGEQIDEQLVSGSSRCAMTRMDLWSSPGAKVSSPATGV